MKTGVLTDPFGNPISGGTVGGSAPAIDANHIYVYSCSETSGTTLVNTGSGSNGDLTLQGSANTNYYLGSNMVGRSLKSYLGILNNGTGGAWSGTSCSVSGGSISIEAFFLPEVTTSGYVLYAEGSTPANDYIQVYCPTTAGVYQVKVNIGGSSISSPNITLQFNKTPIHLLATYDGSNGNLKVYINGALYTTATYGVAKSLATMVALSVGNKKGSTTNSFKGYIAQARFSNSVRTSSYAISTTKTLSAM